MRVSSGRSRARWIWIAVGIVAAYGAVVALLARLTAKVILRPPRWGLDERWPGLRFSGAAGEPADLPPWLCQTPRGLQVVEPSPDEVVAQRASWLHPGDLIRSVDGISTAPAAAEQLALLVQARSAGAAVHLVIERGESKSVRLEMRLPGALRNPLDVGLAFEEFCATCPAGRRVRGWYVPPRDRGRLAPALVFLHGRQTNRRYVGLTDLAPRAHARGYGVLLLDLFGSGESDGDVDFWCSDEARVAIEFLRGRGEVDVDRIGLVGVSFGGMKALLAGTDAAVGAGAVVVLSMADTTPNHIRLTVAPRELPPFIRARLLRGMTLPRWLVESGRPFVQFWIRREVGRCLSEIRPERIAANLRCPVFVAHGTADRTFSQQNARRIFAAIPTPKLFHSVPGHDHFTTAQSGEVLWRHAFGFLDEYLVSPAVPASSATSDVAGAIGRTAAALETTEATVLPAAD